MFNEKSLKVPLVPKANQPTHKAIDGLFFVQTRDNLPPLAPMRFNRLTKRLQPDTEFVVLEHGIGYEGQWAKIKTSNDEIGFVMVSGIRPLENIKEFFPLNVKGGNLPDYSSKDIDWLKQEPMIVYEDEKNGVYAVHYDLVDVTGYSDENSLYGYMSVARKEATKLILENYGKKVDDLTLDNLLQNYYAFSSAEEYYIDPRPCSTLRVLVVIPKRYLNAQSEYLKDIANTSQPLTSEPPEPETPPEDRYFTLSFENFDKYEDYFNKLIDLLNKYNVTFITKTWSIEPDTVRINFSEEANNLRKLYDSINALIKTNYPNYVSSLMPNPFSKPRDIWRYSLDIVIDKSNINLVTIKYHDSSGTRLKLTKGFNNFLNSEEIKNKTSINYLIKFNPEKDAIDVLKSASENAATASQIPVPLSGLAGFGIGLLGGNPEEDIAKFLTEKHYPTVTNASPQPTDLLNCTLDTVRRIQDLNSVTLPKEKQRFELLNKRYEQEKKKNEADLFVRSLTDLTQVKDKNFRVLFGIDPPPGDNSKQQLNNFIAIAKSLDWAKFIGMATQCLSQSLPPQVVGELLKKYQEARKFLEQMALATVCNPYLKNGLKAINSFELPVIPTYNPNRSLADELEKAVVKLVNDLLAYGIKKALEAASKACLSNPNANFNSGGAPLRPIDAATANDPAVSDLLDDFYSSLKNSDGPINGADKESARNRLNDLIQDITSCMSFEEICKLYKGESLNDEVYQVIISLVKRKYGSPFVEKFNNRKYIIDFFRKLGNRLDLTLCEDIINADSPKEKINILCDTGKIQQLRKKLLSDKGLSPEMIDDLLGDIKAKETKNLEDILKILNSDKPFDFSSAPDLGCKIFDNGTSIGPSADDFNDLLGNLLNSVYDTFDREAKEWYKTTYSIKNTSKPSLLEFKDGQIQVKADIQIPTDTGDSIRANSGKDTPDNQKNNSTKSSGIEEIKLPFYMFKEELKKDSKSIIEISNDSNNKYIKYSSFLDGYIQQQLDLDFITSDLRTQIEEGEGLLGTFANQFLFQVNAKIMSEGLSAGINFDAGNSSNSLNNLKSILDVIRVLDIYARSNISDSQDSTLRLDNLYKTLDLGSAQEANALFAAEEGAAIYLNVCAQLKRDRQKIDNVISLATQINSENSAFLASNYTNANSLEQLLDATLAKYEEIKQYYKSVLKAKISYPSYNLQVYSDLEKIKLPDDNELTTYYSGSLYDLQKINVIRNGKNYVKAYNIKRVSPEILNYITNSDSNSNGGLGVQDLSNVSKEYLFNKFIDKSIQKYGFSTPSSIKISSAENSLEQFTYVNEKVLDGIKNRIYNKENYENKFLYLKDSNSVIASAIAESGSGQPYTQYLKLVVEQTPEQKACGVRPNYLDIDSIKKDMSEEKSKNVCVEKIIDEKIMNNQPVNTAEINNMATTSTQKIMLNGSYRLALRMFLHDIVLRSLGIFGRYDPQSLRDEGAFIEFISDMAESEMRGMDTVFFNMMTNFFLEKYKQEYPDEIIENELLKKKQLLRSLVKEEISNFVLPKLAKRIDIDTNISLIQNTPPDNPIRLINIYDDIFNFNDVLRVSGNEVFIKIKNKVLINSNVNLGSIFPTTLITDFQEIEQKIYHSNTSTSTNETLLEFTSKVEFEFLFKYIFPVTQILNFFFMLNCLSTTTRKQVVRAFTDTKKEIIKTCKLIQTNGQPLLPNPNDAQAVAEDDVGSILFKFVLQSLIKTPISIIKGMAEGSEPNIALVSTAYKAVKAIKPDITSFMIPAVSIPLGTIPTPITCPLPYINPILAGTYFATLGWYDDSKNPIEQAMENLEKIASGGEVECKDVKNQDLYYYSDSRTLGNKTISGEYDLQANSLFVGPRFGELSSEQALDQLKNQLLQKVVEKIKEEIMVLRPEFNSINEEVVKNQILFIVNKNKVTSLLDTQYNSSKEEIIANLQQIYDANLAAAAAASEALAQASIQKTTLQNALIQGGLDFTSGYTTNDENEASRKGGKYYDAWLFTGRPTTYAAFEQIVNTEYDKWIEKAVIKDIIRANLEQTPERVNTLKESYKQQTQLSFGNYLKSELPGIKFYGE